MNNYYLVMYNRLFSRAGLSLERLRTFVEVADAGSMAKAANGDAVRQSQFSRQIKELEEHFGRKLTVRSGRNVVLTSEGRDFAGLARQILGALEDFQGDGEAKQIPVTLGSGESFHRGVVLPRLESIRQRLPGIRLELKNKRSSEVASALEEGTIDFGVIDEKDLTESMKSALLGRVRHRLVVSHGPKKRQNAEGLTWRDALRMPFIGMEGRGALTTMIEQCGEKEKMPVHYLIKCASWHGIMDLLSHHEAAAVLPDLLPLPASCSQVEWPGLKPFDRVLHLAWDSRRGSLRLESDKWQRILAELLKL
ncbi:MAG: LysR family transcriptional regulator [Opitutaceae bacterium]|nr:LysR family transcriptional regulator [Opitutaceae bacterium]